MEDVKIVPAEEVREKPRVTLADLCKADSCKHCHLTKKNWLRWKTLKTVSGPWSFRVKATASTMLKLRVRGGTLIT